MISNLSIVLKVAIIRKKLDECDTKCFILSPMNGETVVITFETMYLNYFQRGRSRAQRH